MLELSPVAKSILKAAYKATRIPDWQNKFYSSYAAAVLRTAVEEVMLKEWPTIEDYNEYDQGYASAHIEYRNKFLDIANELESLT
jgi:hypothetical protein